MNQQGKCSAGLRNSVRRKTSLKMLRNGNTMRSRPNDVAVPDEKQSLAGSEKKLSYRVIANDQFFMATNSNRYHS